MAPGLFWTTSCYSEVEESKGFVLGKNQVAPRQCTSECHGAQWHCVGDHWHIRLVVAGWGRRVPRLFAFQKLENTCRWKHIILILDVHVGTIESRILVKSFWACCYWIFWSRSQELYFQDLFTFSPVALFLVKSQLSYNKMAKDKYYAICNVLWCMCDIVL